jgi:hypothetical protein
VLKVLVVVCRRGVDAERARGGWAVARCTSSWVVGRALCGVVVRRGLGLGGPCPCWCGAGALRECLGQSSFLARSPRRGAVSGGPGGGGRAGADPELDAGTGAGRGGDNTAVGEKRKAQEPFIKTPRRRRPTWKAGVLFVFRQRSV